MKKILIIALLIISSSCAMVNAPAGSGFLYTESKELVYFDPYIKPFQKTMLCSKNTLGLILKGDMGLDAFRATSTIRKIASIEKTYSSRLGFYGESCLIVTGE